MIKYLTLFSIVAFVLSCSSNDISEVNELTRTLDVDREEGRKVKIIYSDSAEVKVRITADSMVRFGDKANPRDEFPKGIYVEFLSKSGRPTSWLEAEKAVRYEKEKKFIAKKNVKFYNRKNETLLTTELTWDERASLLYTNKYVSILQPERGDTTYGFGFSSNEEFNIFEIKKRTSSIYSSLVKENK